MKQLIFIKNLFDMKRDIFFEKIGDKIVENLTDSLFQDFEIEVVEKNVNIFIELIYDDDYFDKYALKIFEIWDIEKNILYKNIAEKIKPIIEKEIKHWNEKAAAEFKSDDDTSLSDYIRFCREYY